MLQRVINITLFVFIVFMILIITVGTSRKERQTDNQTTETEQPTQTTITLNNSEIAKHNLRSDCWLLISGKVYDVTIFLKLHPGGSSVMTPFCGKDATMAFNTQDGQGSHSGDARAMLGDYLLGNVNEIINR